MIKYIRLDDESRTRLLDNLEIKEEEDYDLKIRKQLRNFKRDSELWMFLTNVTNIIEGMTNEDLGRYTNAAESTIDFPKNTDSDFRIIWKYIAEGNLYYRKSDLLIALALYEKALNIDPDNPRALFQIAKTHKKLGQYDDALKYYSKLLKTYSHDPIYLNNKADILLKQNLHDEALILVDKALKFNPKFGAALSTKAEILFYKDRLQEANDTIDRAIAESPKPDRLKLKEQIVKALEKP